MTDYFGCTQDNHEYFERECPHCGQVFCFSCCASTNVHEGGKYEPDFMLCPKCGYDYYSDDDDLDK